MDDFKNRLYHFETEPPADAWQKISDALQDQKVIPIHSRRRSKLLFYGATAAASLIIIFTSTLFLRKNKENPETAIGTSSGITKHVSKDSVLLNRKILESIIHNPEEKDEIISGSFTQTVKKYLTIANPDGQAVKISPKVATLIISADNEFPPKPVWSKKIDKWQKIMLASTISPTSINLVNIIESEANNNSVE